VLCSCAIEINFKIGAISHFECCISPDLEASLTFLEKHCAQTLGAGGPDWRTVTYMISEVQYGGRITDDFDRLTFNVFTDAWISQVCAVNGAPFIKPEIGQNFTCIVLF
jgi:hypothetical protein